MSETTSEIEISPRGNVAYLPSVGATVFMDGLPAFAAGPGGGLIQPGISYQPGSGPTNPNTRREWIPGDEEIVFWGMGNDYPQIVRDRFSKNPIIAETLEKKAAFWLGGGVYAATDRLSEEEIDDAEINAFLSSIATQRYLEEALLDLAWYANVWPELILSKDRKKIAQIHNNETAYGRWGRNLDKVYLNANWPNAKATDPDTVVLPCVDPYRWDLVDFIRSGRAYKYAYPLSKPSVGRTFYQLANTDSIISSGWLDVLGAIPLFKKYALKNQMSLLYHVEVSAEYWPTVYGERWDKATFEQKMAIRDEFLADLMKKLTNIQNAHSSVMTDFWYDDVEGKEHGVRIHELKGTKVDGKYSEDYSDGSKQVHYAMGVDQVLTGFTDSDQASQSGGSNKREAFWIFLTLSNLTRRKVLELLNLVADYNGWRQRYPKLTFKFRDTLLTTLDTGHSTAKTSTPTA